MNKKLAINGGEPVRDDLLPYGFQWIDDEDVDAVARMLKNDWITQGPMIDKFEEKVANYCGAEYGVAFSNGTTALHAAVSVAGISQGNEVITTPITFAADANAVVYNDGIPVFADIKEDTLNIDPEEIEKKITDKTKAIIPVDFAGNPVELAAIGELADQYGLTVIEDAAHALGGEYKGRKLGSISDMTMFSFHPVKHITTGEGGMILTDKKKYAKKLKTFRHHGIIKKGEDLQQNHGPWYYEMQELGHNFRITDIQCALGISQMGKLDGFVKRRRKIAQCYDEAFSDLVEIITPNETENSKHAYHIYVIQLANGLEEDRKEVFEALRAENIGVNVHYVPVHFHPFYQENFGYNEGDYPRAENCYRRAITLPMFPKMKEEDVCDVIKAVKKIVSSYR